jgi:hypothetical protein
MKSKILFILTLTLLINTTFAKRAAMLVGVQNYKAFASLESCHGDVNAMKELLKQGGFQDDHIWTIKDASYGELLTASDLYSNVNAFARGIQKGDEVVFFFSGHGVGGSDGKNYLLGADGNIDNPEKYGSISVEEIKQILKEKNPSEVVLIVDACRNFITKEGKGSAKPIASKFNTGKGIKVESKIGTSPTSSQNKLGKTIVKTIYAASEGQVSFERKDKGRGAFTYYLTYLNDSPNSAMDIDMSKDGVITVEDLVQFADNRLVDYTNSQGLPPMNPVYQTEGGITYEPFKLFRYNVEKVVEELKKEGNEPIFQYDQEAELAKIKKFTENKLYLNDKLPVFTPKVIKEEKIEVDNTDLSSWKFAMAQEEEVKKVKAEEDRKAREAKEKEDIYNKLKDKYNKTIGELDKTEDIFVKHDKLEILRNEINDVNYPEVKHKLLPLLEPVYQKIKEAKRHKQSALDDLKPQFERDIKDMEEMIESELSEDLKNKYLSEFKKKWSEYAKEQRELSLDKRFKRLVFDKEFKSHPTCIEMILVRSGSFNREGFDISVNNFYISKYEITQEQYYSVTGNNPSEFKDSKKNPVERIIWIDAIDFCNKLSDHERLNRCYTKHGENYLFNQNANGYRLPTEAEWEFAARGGIHSKGYTYSGSNNIEEVAWYDKNSKFKTHPVGIKQPNELGVYDMSGNVSEWCWDWYGEYQLKSENNPLGASSKSGLKINRGGSYFGNDKNARCDFRLNFFPNYRNLASGFHGIRVVRNAE